MAKGDLTFNLISSNGYRFGNGRNDTISGGGAFKIAVGPLFRFACELLAVIRRFISSEKSSR
jgi:hypothetical protein